jgi:hypothetical protein
MGACPLSYDNDNYGICYWPAGRKPEHICPEFKGMDENGNIKCYMEEGGGK